LGLSIPAEHWEHLLEVYREAEDTPLLHRAMALWFAQQIGLPVRTQVEGVSANLVKSLKVKTADNKAKPEVKTVAASDMSGPHDSALLSAPDSPLGLAYAQLITAVVAQKAGVDAGAAFKTATDEAAALLSKSGLASAKALLLLAGRLPETDAPGILAEASAAVPTLDRALTLVWTRQALAGGLNLAQQNQAQPAGDWQAVAAPSSFAGAAAKVWQWPAGQPLPTSLRLQDTAAASSPALPVTAALRYDTAASAQGAEKALPVTITRTLYRLEPQKQEEGQTTFTAVPVPPGEALSTRALYLDEIHVAAQPGAPLMRYGLAEVPLPPGAAIETGTWGVKIVTDKDKEAEAIARSRAQERRGLYGVPVDFLDQNGVTLRHLLRVSESGRFTVPPARYSRMYQPDAKAYANDGKMETWEVK